MFSALTGPGCASGPRKYSDTEKARLQLEAAFAALGDNDPIAAMQALATAEKLDPKLPEIFHVRSLAYSLRGEPKRAIEEATKALDLRPDYPEVSNTLGKLYMDIGRPDEALPHLKRSAEDPLYRDSYKALTLLGILYYRRGELAVSSSYLSKATVADASRACLAHYYLGHVSMKQGKFREAIQSYDHATRKFCVSFADAHLALGIAYERNREYAKARQKFLDIKSRYPETSVADQAMTRLRGLP